MDRNCKSGPPPRAKIAKDGLGPSGVPEIYYTSRVLDSTARYARFVKKLRQSEADTQRGIANNLKTARDKQTLDFFTRCDRRIHIKNVAYRVDMCMQAYQNDIDERRKSLTRLFTEEEKVHVRNLVEQSQAGAAAQWQEKKDRLAFLLAKREKQDVKYKDVPLTKCAHISSCISKLRAKDTEEIQLYQMREKKMRKLAEGEIEKMWYDVAMKEAEALSVRMELDAIERNRRDQESKQFTVNQIKERRAQRAREQKILKQETLVMNAKFDADKLKEVEEQRERQEKSKSLAREKKEMIQERKDMIANKEAQAKLTSDTWDSLAGQSLAADKALVECRKQKERDLDVCNRGLVEIKQHIALVKSNNESLILEEGRRRQDAADLKRCQHRVWLQNANKQINQTNKDQIKDKEEMKNNKVDRDAEEYSRQLHNQLEQLVKHRELTKEQAKKMYQKDLLDQIEYNKLLKERAKQEDFEQRKKCQLAAEEYQQQINKMLCRPLFYDKLHPFMKQMTSGLKMGCPCPSNYCADVPNPEPRVKDV